eukprot:463023_1
MEPNTLSSTKIPPMIKLSRCTVLTDETYNFDYNPLTPLKLEESSYDETNEQLEQAFSQMHPPTTPISDINIINTLCGDKISRGYIRNIEETISSIIPIDINNICFKFYYHQNKYANLAYKLYVNMKSPTDKFSGKQIDKIIYTDNILNCLNKTDYANKLVIFGFIELVSWTASFESLFLRKKLFVAPSQSTYQFTANALNVFKKCKQVLSD